MDYKQEVYFYEPRKSQGLATDMTEEMMKYIRDDLEGLSPLDLKNIYLLLGFLLNMENHEKVSGSTHSVHLSIKKLKDELVGCRDDNSVKYYALLLGNIYMSELRLVHTEHDEYLFFDPKFLYHYNDIYNLIQYSSLIDRANNTKNISYDTGSDVLHIGSHGIAFKGIEAILMAEIFRSDNHVALMLDIEHELGKTPPKSIASRINTKIKPLLGENLIGYSGEKFVITSSKVTFK